jgi:NitT/TauT family transport system ATP-binding protein
MIEILHDHAGRMDVFALDKLTDYDFGHTLLVIKAGEMLDFLDTPKNMVVLTDVGYEVVKAHIKARKTIVARQLRKLGTFRHVLQILQEAREHQLPIDVVHEELVVRLPTQDVKHVLTTLIGWGRFAELFSYDARMKTLYLSQELRDATTS